jgi:acyl-CoA dehydrogenase
MTEPNVASSDATNIASSIKRDGDDYVLNGEKWWTSGYGRPDCKFMIFMGVSNPDAPKHQRQSQIIVPKDSPGISLKRMLTGVWLRPRAKWSRSLDFRERKGS